MPQNSSPSSSDLNRSPVQSCSKESCISTSTNQLSPRLHIRCSCNSISLEITSNVSCAPTNQLISELPTQTPEAFRTIWSSLAVATEFGSTKVAMESNCGWKIERYPREGIPFAIRSIGELFRNSLASNTMLTGAHWRWMMSRCWWITDLKRNLILLRNHHFWT